MKPIILLASLILVCPAAATQKTKRATTTHASGLIDQDYMLALSTADQFLHAWAARNMDEGLALLSPQLKAKYPEEYFRYYINGLSDPHHQAFEVGQGQRLPSGGFAFPVALYEHYTGKKESFAHPRTLTIVVIPSGSDSWLVNEMPGFVEPEPASDGAQGSERAHARMLHQRLCGFAARATGSIRSSSSFTPVSSKHRRPPKEDGEQSDDARDLRSN